MTGDRGAAVRLEGVVKRFAGHAAVRGLSFTVPRGGIFGLLGPNGAGKTTTIRMIMNVLTPDEGRVTVFGGPAGRHLSGRTGFLPEERGLYPRMPVLDHLVFLGETKGMSARDARRAAGVWLERLGLGDWAARKVQDLSKGMQQKVQFAGTVLHGPELLVLDEPFSGLDPVNAQVMKDAVLEFARGGGTVLFSTHIMEQAERMCERVVIIARGEKVVDGTLAEVKREAGGRHVALTFTGGRSRAAAVLADRRLVHHVHDDGMSVEVELAPGADPAALLRALVAAGVDLSEFAVREPSLQSIFIAKVGAQAARPRAEETVHA
jgi:ABC-2 type transport system ATP-binding protein